MGSGFEGFDFSHEGVKRVVGLFTGFVLVIASAPYCFLCLNQRIYDLKKRKKKRKKKNPPISFHLSRPLHLQGLKSQHHGKSS